MSIFKEKRSKNDPNYPKTFTIDEKHTEQIKKFSDNKDDITLLKENLSELEIEYG